MIRMTPGRWLILGAVLVVAALIASQTVFAPEPLSPQARAFKACLANRLGSDAGPLDNKRVDDTDLISPFGDDPPLGFFTAFIPTDKTAPAKPRTDLPYDARTGVYWEPDGLIDHAFTAISFYAGGIVELDYISTGDPAVLEPATDRDGKTLPPIWHTLDAAMKRCAAVI